MRSGQYKSRIARGQYENQPLSPVFRYAWQIQVLCESWLRIDVRTIRSVSDVTTYVTRDTT